MDSVALGTDTTTNTPVTLSARAQQQGLYLLGKNGMGKSTVPLRLILHDIAAGTGVLLIDPHGDLSLDILARLDPEEAPKVFLVELRPDCPPGLNLFACPDRTDAAKTSRAADNVVHIFKKLWTLLPNLVGWRRCRVWEDGALLGATSLATTSEEEQRCRFVLPTRSRSPPRPLASPAPPSRRARR
jgi:hypothetical protein